MSKIKRSVVIDKTSTGTSFSTGVDIELAKEVAIKLRKAIKRNIDKYADNLIPKVDGTSGFTQKHPIVHFSSGGSDTLRGNATFFLNIPILVGSTWEVTSIQYVLKEKGGSVFLSASSNPSIIAAGDNIVPVCFASMDIVENHAYQLALPFLIIEDVVDFKWSGKAKRAIRPENIRLNSLEFAIYTGDLGEQRNAFLLFLRDVYASVNATSDKGSRNGASLLGIEARIHDNHPTNITITSKSGPNKYFGATFYCKEDISDNQHTKLIPRIRIDIRLYPQFLKNHNIATVATYCAKLQELASRNEDTEFAFWLRDLVISAMHLPTILNLNRTAFYNLLQDLEDDCKPGGSYHNTVAAKLVALWLSSDICYLSNKELAAKCETSESTAARAKAKLAIRLKDVGADLSTPLEFIEHALYIGACSSLTVDQRREINKLKTASSNSIVSWYEMHSRFANRRSALREAAFEEGSTKALTITSMPARKVYKDKLYIHQFLNKG